jgi:hypothetical protein
MNPLKDLTSSDSKLSGRAYHRNGTNWHFLRPRRNSLGEHRPRDCKAESLNAIKQKLLDSGAIGDIATVERFQNFTDHPYTEKYGAVAVFSTSAYSTTTVGESSTAGHPHSARLALMVIRGDDLMTLTHQLYQRAANEA